MISDLNDPIPGNLDGRASAMRGFTDQAVFTYSTHRSELIPRSLDGKLSLQTSHHHISQLKISCPITLILENYDWLALKDLPRYLAFPLHDDRA